MIESIYVFWTLLKEHTGGRKAGTCIKHQLYTGAQRVQPSVNVGSLWGET